MSLRRPTAALLNLFATIRGVISDTRSVHSIFTPVLHVHFFRMRASRFSFILWQTLSSWKNFGAWLSLIILYPCSKCLRVHSNVLTGLSLAIVLARFLAWRRALRRQPRNLRYDDSSRAKIGVILVSCSCGKWSPIDADVPQTASAINH